MSGPEILASIWLASDAIIIVDAYFFLRWVKRADNRITIHSDYMKAILKAMVIAPAAAAVVLVSWLFSALDAFGIWVEKLRKENEDKNL